MLGSSAMPTSRLTVPETSVVAVGATLAPVAADAAAVDAVDASGFGVAGPPPPPPLQPTTTSAMALKTIGMRLLMSLLLLVTPASSGGANARVRSGGTTALCTSLRYRDQIDPDCLSGQRSSEPVRAEQLVGNDGGRTDDAGRIAESRLLDPELAGCERQ